MRVDFAALVAFLAVSLALGGCALQPPPTAADIQGQSMQHVKVPPQWTASSGMLEPVADRWLATFGEPELEAIVREALAYNLDLAVAAARVERAAGYARLAGASIYPAVSALARGGGKMGGDNSGLSGVGITASWELDLWGRARAEREAGTQELAASELDAAFARQSIAAMVAKSWLLAIEARLQRAVAEEIVGSTERFVGLARDRLRIGIGDEYDVTLAEANLATLRDAARQLALGEEQALRGLETLVGRYPAALVAVPSRLPAGPKPVPVGLPSELLERRPDVIAAERRVAAAFFRVEEAKAARLPKISLTAGVTSISSDLFVLQNHSNPVLSLGGVLLAPIFNGWALQSQVEIRTAEQKLAVVDYARVGLRAFNEVEAALSAGFAADERERILAQSVASNARTVELAQIRLRVGSGDLRAVLQQNVALYGARTSLLRAQSERLVQRVNLYLALGGSFEATPDSPATGSAPRDEPARALAASGRQ